MGWRGTCRKSKPFPPCVPTQLVAAGLGVLLFELTTGSLLFPQDIANDNLDTKADKTRLCVWRYISAEKLDNVLKDARCSAQEREDARHLVAWMLRGDPSQRPTIAQVMAHRFLCPDAGPPPPMRLIRYHVFISHSQAEASGEVGTIFKGLAALGIHGWRDMSQKDITIAGMMQGVRDSDVFVVVLTNSTLSRWYCLLEIACAIYYEKPIIIVVEENPTWWPWDIERWYKDFCTRVMDNKDPELREWRLSRENGASLLQNAFAKLETLDFEQQKLHDFLGDRK